jgi:AcrR family transcriptional regulator
MYARPVEPIGRRDRKKLQTRAALVDAALRLAVERGLAHVTVEDISEAADVSPRTFFNYFGSKDEAILDGHQVNTREVNDILATLLPDLPVLAAIRLSLNFTIHHLEAEREQVLLRMRVIEANPGLLSGLIEAGAASEREMAAVITGRLGLPADHPFPPLAVAVGWAAFRTATIRWYAAGGRPSLAALVDQAFTDVAAGLPDPPRSPAPSTAPSTAPSPAAPGSAPTPAAAAASAAAKRARPSTKDAA